ncbi:hypothetical protein MY8738_002645 [Beauveria namnaoensis]
MRFRSRRETILRPILWSPEDLQLFDCHFRAIHAFEPQTCEAAGADDSSDHAALAEREALVLQRSSSPLMKRSSMGDILNDGKLYRQQSPLPFIFFLPVEKQHLARGGLLPMTGYIDYTFIHSGRRKGNHRKLGPGQLDYGYFERLKRITPRAWKEDPYILFILLSMAQSQYLCKHGRHKTTFRASLFVTEHACRQDIYLFDVDIPTALLNQLNDPRIIPQRPTRLDIHRTRITGGRATPQLGLGGEMSQDGKMAKGGKMSNDKEMAQMWRAASDRRFSSGRIPTVGNGNELLQALGISAARLRKLQDAGVGTVHRLAGLECYHIERLMSENSPYGAGAATPAGVVPAPDAGSGEFGGQLRDVDGAHGHWL